MAAAFPYPEDPDSAYVSAGHVAEVTGDPKDAVAAFMKGFDQGEMNQKNTPELKFNILDDDYALGRDFYLHFTRNQEPGALLRRFL